MAEQRKFVTRAPENSETPLEALCSWVTPTKLFFVRNHFDVPRLNAASWRLVIDGCVERRVEISFDDLQAMPQRTIFSTVECAGNGRSFLQPRQDGIPWGAGAIAHAEWTGVPLRHVLDEAGIRADAKELVFEGADRGTEVPDSAPIPFARGMPLAKALHPDTLLATRMNGEPLTAEHGYPVRLLVPGWYGVASVKWLTRITALDRAFEGFFQTVKYTVQRQTPHGTETVSIQKMAVKSEIIRPRERETIGIGTQRVFGVAWAGEDAVARVEVSTDGGRSWGDATLIGVQAPYSWALWEYLWEVGKPGDHTLLARATSARGDTQPMEHDLLRGGYMINYVRPRRVTALAQPSRRHAADRLDIEALLYDMNAFAEANAAAPLDVFFEYSEGGGI